MEAKTKIIQEAGIIITIDMFLEKNFGLLFVKSIRRISRNIAKSHANVKLIPRRNMRQNLLAKNDALPKTSLGEGLNCTFDPASPTNCPINNYHTIPTNHTTTTYRVDYI